MSSSHAYLGPETTRHPRTWRVSVSLPPPPRSEPWLWLVGGAVMFFAVPFLGTDVVGLQPDDARCGARESACGLQPR
jgi:hypothetical protein